MRFDAQWKPKRWRVDARSDEVVRSNANDCDCDAIEMNCLSDNRRIGAKSSSPVVFAHQNRWRVYRVSSGSRLECASVQCGDSENPKIVIRDNENERELCVACASSHH